MNAISIRIEDAALVSKLERLADEHHRSVEMEAIEAIRSALALQTRENRRAIADRIAAMGPRVLTESTALIREDRDRDE